MDCRIDEPHNELQFELNSRRQSPIKAPLSSPVKVAFFHSFYRAEVAYVRHDVSAKWPQGYISSKQRLDGK